METNRNIEQDIEETLNALDDLKTVHASPFFKDKTMQVLFAEQEEHSVSMWTWFTPQLQLASLLCVVVLNVWAFTRLSAPASSYEENISAFAESYELFESATNTEILNY